MKLYKAMIWALLTLVACADDKRVFEKNTDLEHTQWLAANAPVFEFVIDDVNTSYNLYCNIRNEVSYPKANIYFNYKLTDANGKALEQKLISRFLFDKKTGEPFGSSALGDIYDHQVPVSSSYKFLKPGVYRATFTQYMRMDTLPGILAVGLRVEHAATKP